MFILICASKMPSQETFRDVQTFSQPVSAGVEKLKSQKRMKLCVLGRKQKQNPENMSYIHFLEEAGTKFSVVSPSDFSIF